MFIDERLLMAMKESARTAFLYISSYYFLAIVLCYVPTSLDDEKNLLNIYISFDKTDRNNE